MIENNNNEEAIVVAQNTEANELDSYMDTGATAPPATDTPIMGNDMDKQDDGSCVLDGGISIRDLNKEMEWELPTDGPKTVNGLVLEFMEDIPEVGVSIQVAGYPIEIIEVKDNKVSTVKITPSKS